MFHFFAYAKAARVDGNTAGYYASAVFSQLVITGLHSQADKYCPCPLIRIQNMVTLPLRFKIAFVVNYGFFANAIALTAIFCLLRA